MKLDIYSGFWYKFYVKHGIKNQYMRKVNVEKYPNGIIVNEHVHGFGVFDENFKFVKSSRQTRKNNGQFVPKFDHKNIPYIDEDVVFIGNVYPQLVLINNEDVNPVPKYMFKLLELLGVKHSDIIILNETTRFRNVYIPVQGYNIPVYSSNEFGKTFDAIANSIPDSKEMYEIISNLIDVNNKIEATALNKFQFEIENDYIDYLIDETYQKDNNKIKIKNLIKWKQTNIAFQELSSNYFYLFGFKYGSI